jgi:hypothetical protein
MLKWFTTHPRNYYKSSSQRFIVGGTKALVCSSRMNRVVYVIRATEP